MPFIWDINGKRPGTFAQESKCPTLEQKLENVVWHFCSVGNPLRVSRGIDYRHRIEIRLVSVGCTVMMTLENSAGAAMSGVGEGGGVERLQASPLYCSDEQDRGCIPVSFPSPLLPNYVLPLFSFG